MIKNQSASKPGNIDNEPVQCAFILRLFVTGASPNSTRAISNLKREQLIALPLLIKKAPGVERRLIGDMSNKQKVLKGLGIDFSIV